MRVYIHTSPMDCTALLLLVSAFSLHVNREQLTAYSVQYLRHLRDFFGTVFKIKPDLDTGSVMLSCLGTGYKNMSRSAT